jgi:integrase
MLKIFYRWLRGSDIYPEEVKWIKPANVGRVKLPEELLTEEEVMRMVSAADHVRDKAFILVLYESGCRIGELLTMQVKHVQFDTYGAVLHVDGKTGPRRVRIILSAPKLSQWVENHPKRDNPDSALWITIGTNSRYKVWTYTTAKEVIKKIALKAGVRKRIYPHLFRHSRATCLANHLTEAQMKQYFGWTQSSEMASVYVHLSGRDVDNALLKLNGLPVEEKDKGDNLKPLICPRCKSNNSPDAKFCSGCGFCVDVKTAVEIDEVRAKADNLLNELVKDPKVLYSLLEGIEKLKCHSE